MIIFNRILVLSGKNYVKVKNLLQCDTRQPEHTFYYKSPWMYVTLTLRSR